MNSKIKDKLSLVLYMAFAIPMFYFHLLDISLGGIGFMYRYLFGMGIIFMAFMSFLISPDLKKMITCIKDSMVLSMPYLWTLIYSLFLWAFTMAQFKVVTRGFSQVLYQIIAILVAASSLYLYKEKGIYRLLFAMIASDCIFLVEAAMQNGFGAVLKEYIDVVLTFTAKTGPIMKSFENNGHSYAYGFFLTYYVMHPRENKRNLPWAIVAVLFYFLGLKRSGLLAIGVAVLFGVIITRFKNPAKFLKYTSWLLIAFGVIYVIASYYGVFDWMETIGIDTKERAWLYRQFIPYYDIAPGFFGHGAGYVSGTIVTGDIVLESPSGFVLGDIHSDFLRQYIELGFFAYIIWLWTTLWPRAKHFFHNNETVADKKHGILAAVVIVVSFIIYTTENSYYHYYTTMFTVLAIMGYKFSYYSNKVYLPGDDVR